MVGFCLSKISFGGSAPVNLVTPLVKQLWNTSVLQRYVSFVHSIPTSDIATVFNIQCYPFSRGSVRRWLNALQLCSRAWIFDAATSTFHGIYSSSLFRESACLVVAVARQEWIQISRFSRLSSSRKVKKKKRKKRGKLFAVQLVQELNPKASSTLVFVAEAHFHPNVDFRTNG